MEQNKELDIETWVEIPGFSHYQVSNQGRVRAIRYMRSSSNGHGYRHLVLIDDTGKARGVTVHSLVLLGFVGPRPEGYVVCHNNDEPADNRLCNLRYDTQSHNRLETRANWNRKGKRALPKSATERKPK